MRLNRSVVAGFLGACVLLSGGTKKMTVEDSLAIHRVAGPRFSPNGIWVVYTETEWDRKNDKQVSHLWISRANASSTAAKLTNGEKGESAPQWSPDGSRIAFLADRGAADAKNGNQIWLIRPDGGEAEKLTAEENAISDFRWSPDGKRIAFITRDIAKDKADREKRKKDKFDAIVVDTDYTYAHLWTIELAGKTKKRLTEGAFSVSSPRWSPDSRTLAYVQSSMGSQESSFFDLNADRNSDIYLESADGGTPRRLTTSAGTHTSPAWSPDGSQIAYVSQADAKSWAGKSDVMLLAVSGGSARNVSAEFPDSAGGGLKWAPDGNSLYWDSAEGVRHHIFRVAASGGRIVHITEGATIYSDFDLSSDGARIACTVDSGAPADIWVMNATGTGRTRISHANPEIEDFAIARSDAVQWKGPDDFNVEGWLTLPLDYQSGKKYPLILSIHGGPYGANTARFDARAQIFAAQGYAVLAPNPRGSTGYGMKFEQANVSDWGGKDFGDLMAGVDTMIAKGIADPDKLLVMGGSYGGFMTFWTITQTNRFKAAIGHAGISDWYSFFGQSDIPGLMAYGFGGDPWKATATYRKYSPMTYVDKVKTPIMITHGEQDRRVPIQQAEQYYRGLRGNGVEAIFVRYPREGHGISEPNHQIDLVGRQLEWFSRHLGQ
jgi:dipeptidyl aminopeptidase/acylaminoacyl peptidase